MTNFKVSVIVPVYNAEEYLDECLTSVQNQTLKDIEIICVNDGSTDGSLEILEKYEKSDKRFVIIRQENQGAGACRNNGLKMARGEYVFFLDSDDFVSNDLFEKTYSRGIETKADIVLFGGNKYNCGTNQYENANHFFRKDYTDEREVFSRKDIPERIMQVSNTTLWTKLFSRKFILNSNLKFPASPINNDIRFVLLAMCVADRISYVDEKLIHYRVGLSSNLSSRRCKYPTCFLKEREVLYDELNRRNIFEEVEKSYVNEVITTCEYNLDTLDFKSRLEIYKEIISPEFQRTGVLNHPIEYYESPRAYHMTNGAKYVLAWYENFLTSGISDYERVLFEMYILDVDNIKFDRREKRNLLRAKKKEARVLAKKLEKKTRECERVRDKLSLVKAELKTTKKELEKTRKELDKTKKSWSIRLGRIIVWLPGKIKRIFKHK